LISVGPALHGTCRESSPGWLVVGSFIEGRLLTLIMFSKRKSKGA
jgi:hypothetical protein